MGWLKKSLCLVLIFLLLVPASGFAQERSSDTASGGNKYILISNESVDVYKPQYTGAFKINNDQYTINKKIGLNAYKLDVIRPFDTEKHEDKKLQQKISLQKVSQ